MAEKAEQNIENKTKQAIQESNSSLLDIVGKQDDTSPAKVKKVYPINQISPLLENFENELIKEREGE